MSQNEDPVVRLARLDAIIASHVVPVIFEFWSAIMKLRVVVGPIEFGLERVLPCITFSLRAKSSMFPGGTKSTVAPAPLKFQSLFSGTATFDLPPKPEVTGAVLTMTSGGTLPNLASLKLVRIAIV